MMMLNLTISVKVLEGGVHTVIKMYSFHCVRNYKSSKMIAFTFFLIIKTVFDYHDFKVPKLIAQKISGCKHAGREFSGHEV